MEYQVSKGGDFIVVTSVEIELQPKVLSCEKNKKYLAMIY